MINELDTVALNRDLAEYGLRKGDLGTVVLIYEDGRGFEVEFMTLTGDTLAVVTLGAGDIRPIQDREIAHARAVAAAEPRAKIPGVMPLPLAKVLSAIGEPVAQMTGKPPMIARSLLQFFERDARPTGARARAELGWKPTPFVTGVEKSISYFRTQGWI